MKKGEYKFPVSMYRESGDGRVVNSVCRDFEMEIIEIIDGSARVQVGTCFADVSRGDILCVPPSMMFRVDSVDGPASVRAMVFNMSILEENMDPFDAEIFYMFYVQAKNNIAVFDKRHPVHDVLAALIEESYLEYSEKDVCYKLPIRANIYLMMSALLRYYCGSKDEGDRMVYHNVLRMRPVIEYLSEHFTEKTYIDQLAGMINVSGDYFTKMFKDCIGKTPIDYINAMRVNLSMQLLCSTELSMADIADTVGFCNPNYFHKIFKQYIGTSPLAYRKAAQ